jgi:hypothetical protein
MDIKDLDKLCEAYAEARAETARIAEEKKKAQATEDDLERTLLNTLEALEKKDYSSPSGKIYVSHKSSVKVPQGLEREAFFEYLKDRGIFENMITVNSATLNSWYKEETSNLETGVLLIPGLGIPTIIPTLNFRKAK